MIIEMNSPEPSESIALKENGRNVLGIADILDFLRNSFISPCNEFVH
jgi:hypothetical protein